MQYRFSALAAYIPLLCSGIWQASAQHSADAAPVPPEIKAIFDGPRYKDAICGLRVIDLETGQMLINLEPRHKFFIGSVRKIFSVGELLNQIGPTHTFNTPMYRQGTISETGTLHGNLILVASGDLTMGGRTNPDGTVAFSNFDHNEADSLGNAELTGPDSLAGDALEDLGFSRPEILHQMRLLPLTGQFRQSCSTAISGSPKGRLPH